MGDETVRTESDENAEENFPGTSREFRNGDDDDSVSNSSPSDGLATSLEPSDNESTSVLFSG